MKIDPRHLEIVAAIVETGGLTEGAHMLGKSQPSVCRSLAQLEKRVEAALFVPNRRPLQPTEFGAALAEAGMRILKAQRDASDIVQKFRNGQQGSVNVGGTPIFMDGVVSIMIAEFQRENPDVRVNQSYGYADDLIPKLRSGALTMPARVVAPTSVTRGRLSWMERAAGPESMMISRR